VAGIGNATAARLIDDDAIVVGVDTNGAALEQASSAFGDRFVPFVGDIGKLATHQSAAELAMDRGKLRWWVNNAGVDAIGATNEITAEHVDHNRRVLLSGPMFGRTGIRCNSVAPGTIATSMTMAVLDPDLDREEALRIDGELPSMGRVAAPRKLRT
jgi:NAD(P)-dependent dehydrogenase (short-subunit alcohol dehydrogenase family)